MANSYPTAINNYTGAETDSAAGHAQAHNAYESKIGTGASTPTLNTFLGGNGTGTSAWLSAASSRTALGLVIGTNVQAWDADLDTLSGKTIPSGATLADTSSAQTFTTKTLTAPIITSPVLTVGSDAQGDVYYRGASGFTRLAAGTSGQFLKTLGAGANPLWATPTTTASVVDEDDSGSSSISSSTAAAITGADVSVTTTATSHIVFEAKVQAFANPGAAAAYSIQFHDGSSLVGPEMRVDLMTGNRRQIVPITFIKQNAAAGTYTYTVFHRSQDNATSCSAEVINVTAFSIPA